MSDELPSMAFEADARGALDWTSETWTLYTGLAAAQLAGEGWQGVIHPDDLARSRAMWQASLEAGTRCSMRLRLRRHDGHWRWHLVRAVPLREAAGGLHGWAGSATDIDEMVRTELALAEQERRARFLLGLNERLRDLSDPQAMMDAATAALGEQLAVAQVGYGEIDAAQVHVTVHRDWNDGRIPSVVGTRRMEDFGPGFVREMKAERTILIADVTKDTRTNAPSVLRAYEGIRTRAILDVPLVKQGRMVALLFVHHPEPREWTPAEVELVEQTCERLWAAVERARAERARAESEAHLSAVLDALPVGVLIADAKGRVTRHNPAYRAIWGRVPETADWQHYDEWAGFWPGTGRRIRAEEWALTRALLRGEVVQGEGVECEPFGGGPRRFLLSNAAPVRDADGRIVGGVEIMLDVSAQKAADDELARRTQELAQTQLSLDIALAAGRMGVWDWSPLTGEARWNRQMFELLGLPMREDVPVTGELFLSRVHPEDRPALDAALSRALAEGGVYDLESRVIRADGQVRWLVGRGQVLHDELGRACRMVGVNFDITERKVAEQALSQSEARFRLMSDVVPQIVWITDAEGRNQFVNRQWTLYTGRTCEGDTAAEITASAIHPDDAAMTMERFDEARRTGRTFQVEHRVRSAAGEYRWFLARAEPYRDPDSGRITRWFGASVDIHDRKRAEEALARREREFRTLADNTPEVLARYDRQLRHLFVNRAVEQVTGQKPEELLGRTHRELGRPRELCDLWEAAILSVFEQRRPRSVEFQLETPRGPRFFTGQFVPELAPSGEVEQVLGVFSDRTAEIVASQALQEADRRKDEFLATLAHELRNPLAPIRTGIQILRFTPDVPQAAAKTLEMMERQITHMVRMIDDLLDVSRISRGKVELRRERVALRSLLDSAVEASRPLIDAGGHELTLHLPARSLCIDGDPTRLAQVIGNLLNNAAKYTPGRGSIELSAEREGQEAVIRVKDNGVGILPEMLPRVFEMFVQLPQDGSRSQGGLGIGLSLARRLVEMHQGRIEADSAGPGRGAVFTVRLPLAEDPEAASRAPGEPELVPNENAPRVLVVDDNVDAAETLATMLGLLGHDTRAAYGGAEALELAQQFLPAVVFCDIGMPGMNGYEVAQRLRNDPLLARALLVALTGWGSEEDKRRALEAGFDAHLTKPVDIAAMQQLLAELSRPGGPRNAP